MSSRIPARHCFLSAFYYAAEFQCVLEFADGRLYFVEHVYASAWNEFKANSHRGALWNYKAQELQKGMSPTLEIETVPDGYSDHWP